VINEYFSIPKNQWLDIQDEIAELKTQLETCQAQQQAAVEAARRKGFKEGFAYMKERAKSHTRGWMLSYGPNVPENEVYRIIEGIGDKIEDEMFLQYPPD
jgi:flagellar biosynthesis/type III secretory pathway protein FliH